MKKNYEAPALEIITYSLHEAIAANCTIKKYPNFNNGVDDCLDFNFRNASFGMDECKAVGGKVPVEGYCYFSSSGNIVSTS